jgi:hypothetical protein
MRLLRIRRKPAPYILFGASAIATVFLACAFADAKPLHMRDSFPKPEAIFDGRNAQYLVRFDGLVDHSASRLVITRNEKLVETLVPSGDSEPDVLAASAPTLAPGRYQLHWHAKSVPDGDFSDGFISFTIDR